MTTCQQIIQAATATAIGTALVLTICLAPVGCVTTPQPGVTNTVTAAQVDRAAVLLKGVVRGALILVIDKNPTNAPPYITLARDAISLVIGGEDYSPDALLRSLSVLPPRALRKAEVRLAINTVVTAYEIFYADFVRTQIGGQTNAVKLLTAVRDGCADAIRP